MEDLPAGAALGPAFFPFPDVAGKPWMAAIQGAMLFQ